MELPKQREGSQKAGSRHMINNPETGEGYRNIPKRSWKQRTVSSKCYDSKAQSTSAYLKVLPGREGVSGGRRLQELMPHLPGSSDTAKRENEISGGDESYKGKEFEAMSQSQGQRVPCLWKGGASMYWEACSTQSRWEVMTLDSLHGFSDTSTTSICAGAAPRRSPKNRSQENWPPTHRKCGLDESLPTQASVSSPVQ